MVLLRLISELSFGSSNASVIYLNCYISMFFYQLTHGSALCLKYEYKKTPAANTYVLVAGAVRCVVLRTTIF